MKNSMTIFPGLLWLNEGVNSLFSNATLVFMTEFQTIFEDSQSENNWIQIKHFYDSAVPFQEVGHICS